jgi:hypothetical protein
MAPGTSAELVQDIGDRARAMIRWAEDYTGNAGLCYARCKEHDWRSRKRNVNNEHADPQNVRNLTFGEAVDHLRKKHKEYHA